MRFTPWEMTRKHSDCVTRREANMAASDERDIEQQELGAMNKSYLAEATDLIENNLPAAALADVVTSTDVDWLALCRTDLAEASAIYEAALAVRSEAADVDLGRSIE